MKRNEITIDPGEMMTANEAARVLGISPTGVGQLRRAGKLPHVFFSDIAFYRRGDVLALLAERGGPGKIGGRRGPRRSPPTTTPPAPSPLRKAG